MSENSKDNKNRIVGDSDALSQDTVSSAKPQSQSPHGGDQQSSAGDGPAPEYTDDNIRHLSDMEHVRTRPGMYIGRLGDGSLPEDGIYVLLKEVIDNSIDEFKMNAGDRIEVDIEDNLRVGVRDYGRGIPQENLLRLSPYSILAESMTPRPSRRV